MARPANDRRRDLRYEIVGRLAGSLEAIETLPIVNLSRGGVCVRSARPLPVESTNAARLVVEDRTFDFHVRVRHVQEAEASEAGDRYLMGLEFVGVAPDALEDIEQTQLHAEPADDPTTPPHTLGEKSLTMG